MLEALGATSAYPITPFQWMPLNRLTLPGRFSKFVAKAARLTYPYLYRIRRVLRVHVSFGLQILAWLSQGRLVRQINTLTQNSDCVIWDATEVSKKYMEPLLDLFRGVPSYSVRHGLGLEEDPQALDPNWKPPETIISANTTLFAMTFDDIDHYKKATGVSNSQIRATGIFRHHPDWITEISSEESETDNYQRRDSILVISRGYSPPDHYLPRERMLGYLQDIKTVAETLDLRVIIKPHPKETDLGVHAEVFGTASRDVEWEISELHLAILARRTLFAVSFFSGSCLDLTVYGVPTIERLNLVGLPKYDLPSAVRDSTGAPVFQMRQNGHVLGSSTTEEFFSRVEEATRDRKKALLELEEAYSRQFMFPPLSPRALAQQISESCFELSKHGLSPVDS